MGVCVVSVAMTLMILYSLYPSTYCGRCIRASSFLASVGQGPRTFLARLRLDFHNFNPGRRTGLKQACRFFRVTTPT